MATGGFRTTQGAHSESTPGHAAVPAWWRRPWVMVVGALALVVGGAVGVTALVSGEPAPEVAAAPSPTPEQPAAVAVVTPVPSPSTEYPQYTVLTAVEEDVDLYAAAGDATPSRTLSRWSYYGQPTTFLSDDAVVAGGERWHRVSLAQQPNGQTAWVREADLAASTTATEVRVYLDDRTVEVWVEGERELSAESVIGLGSTPTPTGRFYVTDMLDLQANPSGIYGAYAIGLSAYSPTLSEFNGGPPQIAIHGTNATWLLGERASNGCVRVENDVVLEIAGMVDLGTPVMIYDSRDEA